MNALRCFGILMMIACMMCDCSNDITAGGEGNGSETIAKGRITDENGAPVAHARVSLLPASYNPVVNPAPPAQWQVLTDNNGEYLIAKVIIGDYNLQSFAINNGKTGLIQGIRISTITNEITMDTLRLQAPGTIIVLCDTAQVHAGDYLYISGTTIFTVVDTQSIRNGVVTLSGVPSGSFASITYVGRQQTQNLLIDTLSVSPGSTVSVSYSAWKFSKRLILTTAASGAAVSGNVVDFPVLVRLNAGNFNFSQANADGNDLRFAKANGTPLPYEIERWDASQSSAEIWVKVDTVFGNDSSQYINMYWGASTGSATQSLSNSAAVFDTSNGFGGVWHMEQASNHLIADATTNHYDGTLSDTAPIPAQGTIGMAYEFDGIANSISMKGTASSALNFPQDGYYTLSAWVYADTLDYAPAPDSVYANDMTIISKDNCQYNLKTRTTSWTFGEFHDYSGWQATFTPATQRAWKYVVGVKQGTKQYLYVDGKCMVDSVSSFAPKNEPRTTISDVTIGKMPGKRWASLTTDGPGCFFKGKVDEVRIMNRALNADYIKLCFMNQKGTDALVVFK
jgi:hypothetical protein